MKTLHRKAFSSLLAVILTGGFVMFSGSVYGISILPVDTLLQQAYNRIQGNDFSSLTKSLSDGGGNIYDSAYALAKKTSLSDVLGTFGSVSDNLNKQYGCSLTSSDIATITITNPSLNASFAGFAGKTAFAISGDVIAKSCIRIAQCVTRTATGSATVGSLNNAYTQETYPLCTNAIQQAFSSTIDLLAAQHRLDAPNHGDDIFFNGTLDDSPYDLLLDIQRIGDVLFRSNTQAPKVLFYDFPHGGSSRAPVFFDPTGNGTPNLAANIGTNSSDNQTQSNNTSPNQTNNTLITNGINPSTAAQSQALQTLIAHNQSLGLPQGSSSTSSSCITPLSGGNNDTDQQLMTDQSIQASNLEQALSAYNGALDTPNALSNALSDPTTQQNTDTENSLNNIGSATGLSNNPLDKANSCIAKCDNQAPADKVLCQAKCLCGTKYSKDGIFGISVCTVPVAQTEVIGGKSVKSIEEIVDEINNILTALRNSGQLMKHTKPTEFLDTSLSKIKLNQILSFDMNVAFKPIYDSRYQHDQKAQKTSQATAVLDRARQGSYTSVGQQKNKYIILSNPVQAQTSNTSLATPSTSPAPSIDPALPYTLAKTLNNTMIDTISSFLQQNVIIRQQVSETMNAINTTAGNLDKKIENGK